MINLKNKKGFTLIELLVVITIIGILATGATAVYTSQIQKARDTTRINDMETLRAGIEQFYQDKSQYPTLSGGTAEYLSGIIVYIPRLPKDPKTGQVCNKGSTSTGTACDYIYANGKDANGIEFGEYKISTGFENSGNMTSKAAVDFGLELNRYETGLNLNSGKSTNCERTVTMTPPPAFGNLTATGCTAITNIPTAGYGAQFIAGN